MTQIVLKKIEDLKPYKVNARIHSEKQICKIADSIKQFGFNNPILIDKNNTIIAGHGRWEAAKQLVLKDVPTLCLNHLKENQIRAYILADNKLAQLAQWDTDILAIELQHLSSLELGFDIEITGFEIGEIDFLIDGPVLEKQHPEDEFQGPDLSSTPITKTGDLWVLGDHRLYCGNSLNNASYVTLLEKETAQMIFTDPPYNVPISGHVCGKGEIQHREFAMATGEMSREEFTGFLINCMTLFQSYSNPGSIAFCCMDWRHAEEVLAAARCTKYEFKNLCVWVKDNGGMGSLYRSRHELVFVLKKVGDGHINNVELGRNGRYRTNVWEYAGVNTFRSGRMDELAMHPTVKPIHLIVDAIKDCSKRKGIILDPFGGSGTTLLAAEKTGRQARLIEIDPHYCDVAVKRWEALTGEKAQLRRGANG